MTLPVPRNLLQIEPDQVDLAQARGVARIWGSENRRSAIADHVFLQGFSKLANIAGGTGARSLYVNGTMPHS